MFIIRLGAEALSLADSVTEGIFPNIPASKQSFHSNNNNSSHNTYGGHEAMSISDSNSEKGGGGHFLYKLLSGKEDADVAQSRSQLLHSGSPDFLLPPQNKNRSNSLVIVSPRVHYSGSDNDTARPSSVPSSSPPPTNILPFQTTDSKPHLHSNYNKHRRHHPYFHGGSNVAVNHSTRLSRCGSPNGSFSTDSGLGEAPDMTKHILALANMYCGPDQATYNTPSPTDNSNNSPPPAPPLFDEAMKKDRSRTLVHLAKKTVHPVQCHVTNWLRKMVQFVTTPSCGPLNQVSPQLRLKLLRSSWHQMLALYMAETNFRVVTSTLSVVRGHQVASTERDAVPQSFVDDIHDIVELCSRLQIDSIAYDQIRFVIVLIGGKQDLDSTDSKLLESYLPMNRYPMEFLHQIIYKLTRLNVEHSEALFCGHLNNSVDHYLQSLFYNV